MARMRDGVRMGKHSTMKMMYPNLAEWLDSENLSYIEVADELGMSKATLYNVIYGIVDPRKSTIDRLLKLSGMTYEEAFHEG